MAVPSSSTGAAPRKKSRKGLYLILGGVVLIVVLGIAASMKSKQAGTATLVTTDKVVTKTITQLVSATGKIQPEVEVKIAPEVSGEILEMPLREGDAVKARDLLVRIKSDNYRFQVEQREADLVATRASAVDSKARLLKAEEDLRRSEELAVKNLVSESDLLAARTTAEAARAGYESALAQIKRAEGMLSQAQDQLEKTIIYSPMDGTVSQRTSEVGERVAGTGQYGGAEIMRVADLANMEVRVNVNENDIVNVKIGDKSRISIDAYPNRQFTGEVKEIASAAKTTGLQTQEEVTNFQVKIRITDKDVALRPGMSAAVDIETRTVEHVVAVPTQAVTARSREKAQTIDELASSREAKEKETRGDGQAAAVNEKLRRERERADREALQRVVFVRDGDAVKMVVVETGIADTTHTEIKSGLKEGDEVVTGSYAVISRTLKDGMKVRLQPAKKSDDKKTADEKSADETKS
ncbi:MAG: efflux RND transporter periplasmic adaptor subunit [Opitutaceae bacterium]|nr:efflux RND transporter periplasmic adaptor subunit [Opitutaceae bacterium]